MTTERVDNVNQVLGVVVVIEINPNRPDMVTFQECLLLSS